MKGFFLNTLLLSLFISNNTNFSLFIVTVLFFLVCFFSGSIKVDLIKFVVLAGFILAIFLNFMHIETKTAFRIVQLFVGFLFFPLNIRRTDLNIYVLIGIIFYVMFFFIGNAFNIESIQGLILKLYPTEGNSWIILYDGTQAPMASSLPDILQQRLASIYYNPNILGQSMVICFTIYLLHCYDRKIRILDYFSLLLLIILIVGSGSRTAFVALIIVLFFYAKQFTSRRFFWGAAIPVLVYILYFIAINTRLLQILFISNTGVDSMGVKNQILMDYFNAFSLESIFNYLFGHLAFDIQFDNDVGDIIYNLGIFGFIGIGIFILLEFARSDKMIKYFYSFLLLSYGATLIINFKFFMLTILVLSLIRELSNSIQYSHPSLKPQKNLTA